MVLSRCKRIVPKNYDEDDYNRHYTFDPHSHGNGRPAYGKGPVFKRVKKLPRFLVPFPFGYLVEDLVRPFPDNTLLIISPILLIPFIPFGTFEVRVPVGFFVNEIVERLNGIDDTRSIDGDNIYSYGGRAIGRTLESEQLDFYRIFEDLLTNTFALDGKKCMQRLICDLAENPVRDKSMLGEILHKVME